MKLGAQVAENEGMAVHGGRSGVGGSRAEALRTTSEASADKERHSHQDVEQQSGGEEPGDTSGT